MSEQSTDIIVLGAGIMGASAAWHLARRGYRVAVLEQFDLEHERGSSHGASRLFRLVYDQVDYIQLAQQALVLWRDVERELEKEGGCNTPLLWMTGGLDIGDVPSLTPIANALSRADVEYERLPRVEIRRRFPAYRVPDGWEAIYQRDTRILRADEARRGLLTLAQRAGASVQPNIVATCLLPEGTGVSVETSDGRWRADQVVVTTGSWANRLIEPLGLAVPLKVTREHVAYYHYAGSEPILPFMWHGSHAEFVFYGLPNGLRAQIKLGRHKAGPVVDPDTAAVVEQARLEPVQRFVRRHLPALGGEPTSSETCLYATTPDDDFVLDRSGPVVLGVGFGGHGFKFGPLIGGLLADLVQGKTIPFSARFSRRRFAPTAQVVGS